MWINDLVKFSVIKNQFIITGNVFDLYKLENTSEYVSLNEYLSIHLTAYKNIFSFDPITTSEVSVVKGDKSVLVKINNEIKNANLNSENDKFSYLLKKISTNNSDIDGPIAIIFNYVSNFNRLVNTDSFYFYSYGLSQMGVSINVKEENKNVNNLIIWVAQENNMPDWYKNNKIKEIVIPKPTLDDRLLFSRKILAEYNGNLNFESKSFDFAKETNGFLLTDMLLIYEISKEYNIDFNRIEESCKIYKYGKLENPWKKINKDNLENVENVLSQKVLGQDEAVRVVSQVLKRSFLGLSGSQFNVYSQKPKGILFFAGPTGTGKTELAKSIASFVFGNEDSYVRFDMSEFSKEHADQRLIGAPPGYTGFDKGGELTNKAKENPFSVFLFDEIEKANPKIFDIFLQILDEGRLTSSKGETVYFNDSIIIFTSNLGIMKYDEKFGKNIPNITFKCQYKDIKLNVTNEIENYFNFKLNRPELLGRIGSNLIIFDYIRKEIGDKLFEKMIGNICKKIEKELNIKSVTIDKKWLNEIKTLYVNNNTLELGGRGIGNAIESNILNALSEELFSYVKNNQITKDTELLISFHKKILINKIGD